MNTTIYPTFCPSIDRGTGRTRALLDELLRIHAAGCPEGAAESLNLLNVLDSEHLHPAINYHITEESPVFALMKAFAQFITDSQPPPDRQPVSATGVANATGGLTAVLMAHGVSGGEVITTSLNFPGVPNAIMMAGARPRFVDVDERDWCMSMPSLEAALGERTRAIILTHLNKAIDAGPISDILARKGYDIPLIQDASVAMGSTCRGMRPGAVRTGRDAATVYSFAVSKALSGLGGGMVVAHDPDFLERIHAIAYQGLSLKKAASQDLPGANIKMNDLNAAVALAQFTKRETLFEQRRRLYSWYRQGLEPLIARGTVTLQDIPAETVITHFAVTVPDRDRVARSLWERHRVVVGTWPAGHLQPVYRHRLSCGGSRLAVTEGLSSTFSFLPFYAGLAEEDVRYICAGLTEILEET